MKTFRFIGIAIVAILLSLSACSGGDDDSIPTPDSSKSEILISSSITTNGVVFTAVGGKNFITFNTSDNWTLSVTETGTGTSWCIPSATSGDKGYETIWFTVTENTNADDRSVIITIKSGTSSATFTVKQKGAIQMVALSDHLSMHPKGFALQYAGIVDFKEFFDNNIKYDKAIIQEISSKFDDVFDFIFFLYNIPGGEFDYGGFFYGISYDIDGIGQVRTDGSSRFGNLKQLKGISHLTSRTSLFSAGPFLHELGHYWGAVDIGQEYALPSGTYATGAHWGTSDINGILGGFDYKTLIRNVDGNPNKYHATSSRAMAWGFKGFSQELSSGYYAPLELYLMGLVPSDSVPDMHIFQNVTVENNTSGDGTFYAESETTLTIEDVIAKYGKRIPDYQSSQKDFRALVVVVTNAPVTVEEWDYIEHDILKQEKQGAVNDAKQTNFWEATGGRATLTISGIDKFLKK